MSVQRAIACPARSVHEETYRNANLLPAADGRGARGRERVSSRPLRALTGLAFATLAHFAHASLSYQQPPDPIPAMLDAPRTPLVLLSPDQRYLLELQRAPLMSIEEVSEPYVAIAGLRVNPATNGPAREPTHRGLAIKPLGPGAWRPVALPPGSRIRDVSWSTDSRHLALTLLQDDGIELWVLDVPGATPRRLTPPALNAAYGAPCDWLPEDEGLLCRVVPEGRGPCPPRPRVPEGPLVEENLGRRTANRTYTDLLQSPHDELSFDHYLTSVIEHVGLDGSRTRIAGPAIFSTVALSPDGRFVLAETVHRPYSYQVPMERFPLRTQVLDRTGRVVSEIADRPLADDVPITFGSVRKGPRAVRWRSDVPSTLTWIEALDEGDASRKVPLRDALLALDAPFTGQPRTLWRSELRMGRATWGRADLALVTESWWATRRTRTWRIDPSRPEAAAVVLFDRSSQDAYSDPGSPVLRRDARGQAVLRLAPGGHSIYLQGRGASPAGVHPFLDVLDLGSKATRRLWQAEDPWYEDVVDVLDDGARRLLTRRESQDEPPNYFVRTRASKRITAVTEYPDPAPQLAGLRAQVLRYRRADGVDLSGKLYLPPGYEASRHGALPTLLWAYPTEFKSRSDAAQVTSSENTFTRPLGASHLYVLTQGWAILDDPALPIVGEGDAQPNDTYVEQLVAGARAAVEALVQRGIADPDRIAIGGHSYGAFTTANLLAHSDLFRAGVARSGAYNRTLTPFSFQGEERSFWQAQQTYIQMSPFTHAASIDEPLLLIHGAEDSNSGTFPIQSERLYEAMKGLGGTVRWVSLPYEDHGYRARESVGHALWEMATWLDAHVKRAPPRKPQQRAAGAPSVGQ
jgi:dipeptidyl aminopeptidase/acylaminoacyl peptidase